jgi:hypothetical protein
MDKINKGKAKQIRRANVLESLKEMGDSTGKSIKDDLLKKSSEEFFKQLFGNQTGEKKYSGDLTPGESLSLDELYSGEKAENEKLRAQIALERNLNREEKQQLQEKGDELKVRLHALMQEVFALSQSTQSLGEEIKVAAFEAPVNPGVYHVVFFEKLIGFIKSFREKIDNASIWLSASNKRAEKKNYWSSYKKSGSKFFLSSEHYLQRSAG